MQTSETFKHINAEQVHQQLGNDDWVILDIRDPQSFANSRIHGAIHLTNDNLSDFVRNADLDKPTVICCYHGISSQQAANYLVSLDFSEVYSLDGGFEHWLKHYPDAIDVG
ncbi:thiosulfate sulfurtransferase GlpE [Thalassotalea aquiviva]|uniref:thiosulfate sulfurtransferase GlpE n=1 Tax=Thalassotalea aquiviva TaxID=3242415 RepID=UPI00352AB4DC